MGFLAAHEIGELVAILGDAAIFGGDARPDQRLECCWEWLRGNHKPTFGGAFRIAIESHRRKLRSGSDLLPKS